MIHLFTLQLLGEKLILVANFSLIPHTTPNGGQIGTRYAFPDEPGSRSFCHPTTYPTLMKVRGRRHCKACGTEWSYYETGSLDCPACGSIHSRGLDDTRTRHTDTPVSLDTDAIEHTLTDQPLKSAAREIASIVRDYTTRRGFIHAGTLKPLDAEFRLAVELQTVGSDLHRTLDPSPAAKQYLFDLVDALPAGNLPEPVPPDLEAAHGLAAATAVRSYRRDFATWLEDNPQDDVLHQQVTRIRAHERRIQALDGAVPPATADKLVAAIRDLTQVIHGDDAALARVTDRLDDLDDTQLEG